MLRTFALVTALLFSLPVIAQTSTVGDWSGELDISSRQPGAPPLTIILHISEGAEGLSASLDSPDQGAYGLPFDAVVVDADSVTLTATQMGITYSGHISADSISGTWNQGQVSFPLTVVPHVEQAAAEDSGPKEPVKPGDYTGRWTGIIEIDGGGEIHMTFRLDKQDDGTYDAYISAPAQGADDLSLGKATISGRNITIPVPPASAQYVGTISEDERSVDGEWQQGGEKTELELARE